MKFHERLKALREETGMNQKDFAASMGMEQSKYNKWENGKNAPDYEGLCQIADNFNVSTDYLLGRTGVKSPDVTVQGVCEYTGLSQSAVSMLHTWMRTCKEIKDPERFVIINELITSTFGRGIVNQALKYYQSVLRCQQIAHEIPDFNGDTDDLHQWIDQSVHADDVEYRNKISGEYSREKDDIQGLALYRASDRAASFVKYCADGLLKMKPMEVTHAETQE